MEIFSHIYKKLLWYMPSKKKVFIIMTSFCFLLLVAYIILFINAHKIQTFMTFPWKEINLKELSNHPAWIIDGEEINIESSSGNNINGIFIDKNAEKTVYYFHGNGAPMEHFYTEMRYISDLWYNLASYDFPGYGKSEWEPSFEEIQRFSSEFYDYVKQEKNLNDSDVIIWGYSVWSAVAIDFAKGKQFDSLVLFAPFASRYDMSSKVFWFPIQRLFFLKNTFVNTETIQHITIPTFIIHGNTDIVVPFEQGKQVFENSWAQQKYFLEIDDFWHSLITERYGEVLDVYLQDFLHNKTLDTSYIFLSRTDAQDILVQKNTLKEKQHYLDSIDMVSDTSLQKFVNPDISFSSLWYIPQNMKALDKTYITDTKGNAQMLEPAKTAFEKMAEAFFQEFNQKIVVVSSYRSYAYQAGIKARWCPDNLCAKAWYSEHQSWLTVDLWSASSEQYWKSNTRLSEYYDWLDTYAHTFGFHNTYQKGRQVDWYEIEPWHWRYLWVPLATHLKESNLTFAEFYYKKYPKEQ